MQPEDPEKVRRRVASHAARQRAKGLTRVSVWVPADNAADVHAYAERLRKIKSPG